MHWAFATATEDLVDVETGETVALAEERVLMIYPMFDDANAVRMRVKKIDAATGQLSAHWVTVYDIATQTRLVKDFGFN